LELGMISEEKVELARRSLQEDAHRVSVRACCGIQRVISRGPRARMQLTQPAENGAFVGDKHVAYSEPVRALADGRED
jgi:hypothetical protein